MASLISLDEKNQNCYIQAKRTNSLGWAKSDCHTCTSIGHKCDRARPKCGPCIDAGTTCGGYVQALNWDKASSLVSKPQKKRQASVQESNGFRVNKTAASNFTIVQETGHIHKARKPGRRKSAHLSPSEGISASPTNNFKSPTSDFSPTTSLTTINTYHHSTNFATPAVPNSMNNFFSLPSETLQLLGFYQSRFSYTSLTFAVNSNPWHACLPIVHQTPWLRDLATALAERQKTHLEKRPEALRILEHKTRALKSLASSIETLDPETGLTACLLLIALDYAESALSNWRVHLLGASRLLEAHGGIMIASHSRKLRSQICMLVWYDLTFCLLSRCSPAFPRAYIEQLLAWENASEWTSLLLNGCPGELLLEIYDIAALASRASALQPGEAAALELRVWDANFHIDTEDNGVSAMSECWRMALLLYISRVFHPSNNNIMLNTLSEEILRLVDAMPGDATTQKQCLLPIILAACEMKTQWFRQIAVEYCNRWTEFTGIWIFGSALKLIRSVWREMDTGNETVWWGDKVPRNSSESYLFG